MYKIRLLILFILILSLNLYPGNKTLRFSKFTIKYGISILPVNTVLKNLKVYLPLPATTNYQKLVNFKFNVPGYKILHSKKHKAKYLYIKLKNEKKLSKRIKLLITVTVKKKARFFNLKKIRKNIKTDDTPDLGEYLISNKYVNSNRRLIKYLAEKIKGASVYYQVKYLVEAINRIIKKKSRFRGLRYMCDILTKRDGECSDYVSVFVAVMRRLKIPARHVAGRIITHDLKKSWHIWAEIYLKGLGWVPVDPFYYNKNKKLLSYEPDNYIILHKDILLPGIDGKLQIPILQTYYYLYTGKNSGGFLKIRYIWKIKKNLM